MASRIQRLPSLVVNQVPTVLSLAVLGLVAWWGFIWDWKIPSLPELLHRTESSKPEQPEKREDKKQESPSPDKPLPPVTVASEEKLKAAGIEVTKVEERPVSEFVSAHGHIEFNQNHYAHLSTRANGTAFSVHKREGDEVKKDDVLALIAAPSLAQLKFDLQQTLLTALTRERTYNRKKMGGDATPKMELENAEAALREARIRLFNDQQSLQNLGLTLDMDELRRLNDEQVTSKLQTLGIPDSLLQRLENKTLTNNLLPMYAPFSGEVIKRDIVIGEVVAPGTPQFVLADLSNLWIMLHVRLEDAGKMALGQDVAFRLDATGEDAPPARITWISAAVDEKTRTVSVRAEVPNPKGQLRPGTFGDARVLVRRDKRLVVPSEALQFDGQSQVVFVQGESATEFQPVRVEVELFLDDYTVALTGVQAGQTIVTSGSHTLLAEMLKERISGEE